jgi:hypothetical protein
MEQVMMNRAKKIRNDGIHRRIKGTELAKIIKATSEGTASHVEVTLMPRKKELKEQ